MEILPISNEFLPKAASLFSKSYQRQRLSTPQLPMALEDSKLVETMLEKTFNHTSSLVAVDHGEVKGFLSWFLVDHFRGSDRKGAYVPEWGHACLETGKAKIYQALYRRAAEVWATAGCKVHAITILAHDQAATEAWFWNGFGLTVVDSIRPIQQLGQTRSTQLNIRQAVKSDLPALAELDKEHCQHYSNSPIFMPPMKARSVEENEEYISRPKNSIWVAEDHGALVGFLRFDGYEFDSVAIVSSEDGILINGAFVRPIYRGQKIAIALLDAALENYQARGFQYCTVNFESFNPEATSFWMKYFSPVCYSLVRVPES